jgi:restriction system protein
MPFLSTIVTTPAGVFSLARFSIVRSHAEEGFTQQPASNSVVARKAFTGNRDARWVRRRSANAEEGARNESVGPAGLEPATYGLKVEPSRTSSGLFLADSCALGAEVGYGSDGRPNVKLEAARAACRRVIKRVVEWEDYSTCWENEQLKAQGLVAKVRAAVNAKDSFTRMNEAREMERQKHQQQYEREMEQKRKKRQEMLEARDALNAVFAIANPWKRGKALEKVLNRLFRFLGVLVREDFKLVGDEGEGIVEQIDGVIELDGHLYLVEMKWEKDALDVIAVSRHLSRLFVRDDAMRGIVIAANGYGGAAIAECKKAITKRVIVLLDLHVFVRTLETEGDLLAVLRKVTNDARIQQNPYPNVG